MQRYNAGGDVVNSFPRDDQQFERRTPPYNLEAEQGLLGAIIVRNDVLDRVIDFLGHEHFFDQLHAEIYRCASSLIAAGTAVTPVTLAPNLGNARAPDQKTILQYLGTLAASATTAATAREYGRTIMNMATRRQLILIAESMIEAACEAHIDFPPANQIEEAETRLFSLVERGEKQGDVTFDDAIGSALATSLRALAGHRPGLPTGLADLDSKLGGMQPSDLIILAGRPAMGKTALCTNIAVNLAKQGKPVGFFSLEMSAEQVANRVLADYADIASDKLRLGQYDRGLRDRIQELAMLARKLSLHIDQTGGLSIAQFAARARRMKRRHDIKLVVVDYLQLMHSGKRSENRTQDITQITMGLKAVAKELNVPILALSQLSRAVEGRDNKRPQLSDLRESGSIEQDADVVMFVYREEYYLDRKKPPLSDIEKYADWNKQKMQVAGKAEVDIAKNRHGPIGTAVVQFTEELTRFSNLATGEVRHVA